MDKQYATVGETPLDGQSKKIWQMSFDDYKVIDPKSYFVTTGEATVKIDVLIEDIQDLLKNVRSLKKKFAKIKDESDYLETSWENNTLLIKKKEKRSRAPFKKKG